MTSGTFAQKYALARLAQCHCTALQPTSYHWLMMLTMALGHAPALASGSGTYRVPVGVVSTDSRRPSCGDGWPRANSIDHVIGCSEYMTLDE